MLFHGVQLGMALPGERYISSPEEVKEIESFLIIRIFGFPWFLWGGVSQFTCHLFSEVCFSHFLPVPYFSAFQMRPARFWSVALAALRFASPIFHYAVPTRCERCEGKKALGLSLSPRVQLCGRSRRLAYIRYLNEWNGHACPWGDAFPAGHLILSVWNRRRFYGWGYSPGSRPPPTPLSLLVSAFCSATSPCCVSLCLSLLPVVSSLAHLSLGHSDLSVS